MNARPSRPSAGSLGAPVAGRTRRGWIRRALGAAAVGAAVLLAAGCAASGLPSSGPLAVYPRPDAGMDALLQGTIRLDDECVTVWASDGIDGRRVVPVFPAGDATWSDGVLSWRGAQYREGDEISLGGGFTGDVAGAYVPAGCGDLEAFSVSPY